MHALLLNNKIIIIIITIIRVIIIAISVLYNIYIQIFRITNIKEDSA